MAYYPYQNLYRQRTRRCKDFDYSSNADYFVTINTLLKKPYFGEIVTTDCGPSLLPSKIGLMATECWLEITQYHPFIKLDAFCIMPDHIHGILTIDKPGPLPQHTPNQFGPQTGNLGAVIRGFKCAVKRYANKNSIEFHWQPRYHDIIIKSHDELIAMRNYIRNNPNKAASHKNDE